MKRVLVLVVLAIAGLATGAATAAVLQDNLRGPAAAPTQPPATPTVVATQPAAAPDRSDGVLVAWMPGGTPGEVADRIARIDGVVETTLVRGDLVGLVAVRGPQGRTVTRTTTGHVIPLDAIAVDPTTYPAFLPPSARAPFRDVRRGGAVLGATAARLRDVGRGAKLELADGRELTWPTSSMTRSSRVRSSPSWEPGTPP